MNISLTFILFAIKICHMAFALAEEPVVPVGSGKPDHGANRDLSEWSSHSHSHSHSHSKSTKHSKSTDSPTLFPTQAPTLYPTLFPTLAPTYCGKASKSWGSGRELGDWTSKSSKTSCRSGSRSWRRALLSRHSQDGGNIRKKSRHNWNRNGGGKGGNFGQGDEADQDVNIDEATPDEMKVRRRINVGKRAQLVEPGP
mmetsp:Transcript_23264/g.50403  ORF Transcript_23264/g.50403 Transcript_23264/m.50403 type:complete len:198 (+) Transcript_23264:514-1107(+)